MNDLERALRTLFGDAVVHCTALVFVTIAYSKDRGRYGGAVPARGSVGRADGRGD
jgi:hypothetical protein